MHADSHAWFASVDRSRLLVPTSIIAEICYMIALLRGPHVESAFLQDLAQGAYGQLIDVTAEDVRRMGQLVSTYSDLPLGGADASLVAIAERLDIAEIATVDHRHFTVVRPTHTASFTLLPD